MTQRLLWRVMSLFLVSQILLAVLLGGALLVGVVGIAGWFGNEPWTSRPTWDSSFGPPPAPVPTPITAGSGKEQSIVRWAITLQDRIWGIRANEYDPADPILAPAYAYWIQKCGGYACDVVRSGNLQCVQFVMAVWYMAGMSLPVEGNGVDFWTLYDREGWQRIPTAAHIPLEQRGWPAPGDIMVWSGELYGHVAIVIDVQLPQSDMDGTVTVANANVAGNRWPPERQTEAGNWYTMPLHADKTVSTWPGYQVLGYLRPV